MLTVRNDNSASVSVPSFWWEEVSVHSRGAASVRLLAVGSQWDLKLLEVEADRSASVSLHCVSECAAADLLQMVREQDHGEYLNLLEHSGCRVLL